MPSPATPRRSSGRAINKTPVKKSVDIGKPLGPYDNNSVRERVRQWQAEGGGVITTEDLYAGNVDDGESPKKSSQDQSQIKAEQHTQHPADALSVEAQGSGVRETAKEDASKENKAKSVSTPRKRIVSDGHWVRKRSPPKNGEKSKPITKVGIRRPSLSGGARANSKPTKPSDSKSNAQSSKALESSEKKKPPYNDGIRVYATPPASRRPSNQEQELPESESKHDIAADRSEVNSLRSWSASPKLASSAEPQKSRDVTPEGSPPSIGMQYSSKKQKNENFNKSPQEDQSPPNFSKEIARSSNERRKSKKASRNLFASVFDESKRMFSRTETVYVQPSENPRIDAWLGGVPDPSDDPFLEDEPLLDVDEPPVEMPAPLNVKSHKKRHSKENESTVEDANKIWDSVSPKEDPQRSSSGRPRRRRTDRRSSNQDDSHAKHIESTQQVECEREGTQTATPVSGELAHDTISTSPSSTPRLQRRNARRKSTHSPRESPRRDERESSPLKESFTPGPEEKSSQVSSANTESSVEPIDLSGSLKPSPLTSRRPFPSVGQHRLSTILSVDTLGSKARHQAAPSVSELSDATLQPSTVEKGEMQNEASDHLDPDSIERSTSKSRLTRHTDLISVLSAPRGGDKSIMSARSIRTNRSRLETATIDDVLKELADDEIKYMRELKTLVDGVIPVLLSCVLSKTESAIAAGLFSRSGNAAKDPAITKPIIDMGICLEGLKKWHKRIEPRSGRPTSVTTFITWAQGVHRIYSDYLKSWRMGFQDVVVNLAPAGADEHKEPDIEGGLPRNEHGDIIDNHGERVDVAFLLKRPLVRLKYLAKTLRGINHVSPSPQADKVAADFQSLVEEARNRTNEERARLEDEAAANIDATRARDLQSLGPLSNIHIDKSRRVRARDSFDLTLLHTSGQRVDCRVELLLRDDPPGEGVDADLLICEVDGTGRWLLFPPVRVGNVSARNGDVEREIVVMIRGEQPGGGEWRELFSLVGDEERTGFEWVQMLGLTPIPPQISEPDSIGKAEKTSILEPSQSSVAATIPRSGGSNVPTTPVRKSAPDFKDIAVPLGESFAESPKSWRDPMHDGLDSSNQELQPPKSRTRLQKRSPSHGIEVRTPDTFVPSETDQERLGSGCRERVHTNPPASPSSPSGDQVKEGSPGSGIKRYVRKRDSKASEGSPTGIRSLGSPAIESCGSDDTHMFDSSLPASSKYEVSKSVSPSTPSQGVNKISRQRYHQRTSSMAAMDPSALQKGRKSSEHTSPAEEIDEDTAQPFEESPSRNPRKLTKPRPQEEDPPPPPPPHKTPPSSVKLEGAKTPDFSPGLRKVQRRPSSPLKHEYEPSTATESSSESESEVENDGVSSRSDTSEEEDPEEGDVAMPLLPVGALRRSRPPPSSLPSLPSKTLGPSSSASQAPYKTVPAQPQKASRTIASIFYWSDKGSWEILHPDECSIAITPGLIEAFELTAAHSYAEEHGLASSKSGLSGGSSNNSGSRPLIALELTPLVPIRRGTAIDISIRSPPTAGSKITTITNNNVMFRSRSPEECEALYALINYSRINNPTYIALQNARATSFAPQLVNASLNRGKTTRTPASSWFGLNRRRSYRASSAPTPSISRGTESSVNSASSAFSALKMFKANSSRFSIRKSTVLSRTSSRTGSIYTSSDNSSGSGSSTPIPGGMGTAVGPGGLEANAAPIGLSNAKIRLYIRESASKWRDLGSARLTIMRPTNASHPVAPSVSSPEQPAKDPESTGTAFGIGAGGAASPGRRQSANDKRIVVIGKSKGDTLLDVTLGESCFERVARTGIAVSVWENFEGGMVAKQGGVVGGRLRVFMVQMKSEAETAYTFGIVGRLRY